MSPHEFAAALNAEALLPDILGLLRSLVAFDTVRRPAEPGMPFGRNNAEALKWLLDLAERAAASGDVDVRLLGRKARLYLATLPGETMDLDAVRLEIVEKILALRAALGDDPAPAVASNKEGGAK